MLQRLKGFIVISKARALDDTALIVFRSHKRRAITLCLLCYFSSCDLIFVFAERKE